MTTGILDLAIVILLVSGLGVLARLLRQPLVLAYLATGAVIGYLGLFHFDNKEFFQIFSDLGIMFLLFLIGLEINYASLKIVGKTVIIIGLGQILFTSTVGFALATLFGFALLPALYIAIALTFSSTVIVVKILSDKKDLNSLYGKISIGFLLVQDFVAIIILLLLSGIQKGGGIVFSDAISTIAIGIGLFVLMFWLGRNVMPKVFDLIAHSQELLFLMSLAWVFLLVSVVQEIGFSIEIGGFLAGIALANSSEHFQIAHRIKSLRDFFILIFFVILGSSLVLSNIAGLGMYIAVFSLFVLIGNPLIVMALMGLMGYRRRTGFLAGITVAQISEFSLILAALGLKTGHITEPIVALITAVGVITITVSTYLMTYANSIFSVLSPQLRIFERDRAIQEGQIEQKNKPIILVGFHRTGQNIGLALPKKDLLVVDFDPDIMKQLRKNGFDFIFGDIADPDVMQHINIENARLVISTNPVFEDNMRLLHEFHAVKKPGTKIVLRARTEQEAQLLYQNNCDYVLLPHFTAGHFLGKAITESSSLRILSDFKKRDMALMQRKQNMLS